MNTETLEESMPAETAEARGSDAPDCCAAWTRSGEALEPIAILTSEYGVKLEKMRFKFCPWCGCVRTTKLTPLAAGGTGGAQKG